MNQKPPDFRVDRLYRTLRDFAAQRAHGDNVIRVGDDEITMAALQAMAQGEPIHIVPAANEQDYSVSVPTVAWTPDERTVGLWHFNGDATDAGDNDNDGTVAGTTAWGTGQFDQCLTLTNGRVTVADATSLDVNRWLCFEAWVKTSAAGTIAERDGWKVWIDASMKLNFQVGADTITSAVAITADTWTFIVAQYSTAAYGDDDLWVAVDDVVKRQAATETAVATGSDPLYLGNNAANDDPLVGSLDEVRFSSLRRYVSDGQVARARPSSMDVATFNFEENVGDTAYNSRFGEANLTLSNTSWVAGLTGYGLSFNGTTSYASATFQSYTPTKIAVGGWFKFVDLSGNQVLVDQTAGVGLQFTGTHLRAPFYDLTELNTDICAWAPLADTWYEIYATYDGTSKAIWIDNQKWGEVTATGTPTTGGICYVGRSSGAANYFEGSIDDLVISRYDRRPWRRPIPYFVVGQAGMKIWEDWQIG